MIIVKIMKNKLYRLIKLLRPKQWLKNFAVFVAIMFTGQLFNPIILRKVVLGFITFCSLIRDLRY